MASSMVSGLANSSPTRTCNADFSASLRAHFTSLFSRSRVACSTLANSPSLENVAQPASVVTTRMDDSSLIGGLWAEGRCLLMVLPSLPEMTVRHDEHARFRHPAESALLPDVPYDRAGGPFHRWLPASPEQPRPVWADNRQMPIGMPWPESVRVGLDFPPIPARQRWPGSAPVFS